MLRFDPTPFSRVHFFSGLHVLVFLPPPPQYLWGCVTTLITVFEASGDRPGSVRSGTQAATEG